MALMGRCPRLLYESPSGILSVSITPGLQREMWDTLCPQGEEGWNLDQPLLFAIPVFLFLLPTAFCLPAHRLDNPYFRNGDDELAAPAAIFGLLLQHFVRDIPNEKQYIIRHRLQ